MNPSIQTCIDILVEHGYTVTPPADMLVAGPWQRNHDGLWLRHWQGSDSVAASVVYHGRLSKTAIGSGGPAYLWRARLRGTRKFGVESGWAPTLEKAQAAADAALVEKLLEARRGRQAACTSSKPSETLSLPAEDVCASLEEK